MHSVVRRPSRALSASGENKPPEPVKQAKAVAKDRSPPPDSKRRCVTPEAAAPVATSEPRPFTANPLLLFGGNQFGVLAHGLHTIWMMRYVAETECIAIFDTAQDEPNPAIYKFDFPKDLMVQCRDNLKGSGGRVRVWTDKGGKTASLVVRDAQNPKYLLFILQTTTDPSDDVCIYVHRDYVTVAASL